jgi:hypothetical protein
MYPTTCRATVAALDTMVISGLAGFVAAAAEEGMAKKVVQC